MGKVADISKGIHLSITAFASEFGSTRETIAKRIAASNLIPSGQRGGHPVYRLRDLHRAVYQGTDDGKLDPDKLDPFQRKAHYQAEHEMLIVQTERGELVPRIEVEQGMARVIKTMVQCLDTLPDLLERNCGLAPRVVAQVEAFVDVTRTELRKQVIDGEEDFAIVDGAVS